MPIHDWTRAPSGYFHHFHQRWAAAICDALNGGVLPPGVFALLEQHAGGMEPDVLALELPRKTRGGPDRVGGAATAVALRPPQARFVSRSAEDERYAARANRVVLRRSADDVLAIIEIVSPGNKHSRHALRGFVEKSLEFLLRGVHLLVVDLLPPTPRDPQGIHAAIWGEISDEPFELPADKRLTVASYVAGVPRTAYVEPVAIGDALPPMPVFLDPATYVPVPLEPTYDEAWRLCPQEFKDDILGDGSHG
jgi:hypothetical protein